MNCHQPSHPEVPCNAVSKHSTQNCDSLTEGTEGFDGQASVQQNPTHPSGISESENHRRELEEPNDIVKQNNKTKGKCIVKKIGKHTRSGKKEADTIEGMIKKLKKKLEDPDL